MGTVTGWTVGMTCPIVLNNMEEFKEHLDTGWTLSPKNSDNTSAKKSAKAYSHVNPPQKSTSETPYKWAIQDSNL
jgi:hypothetical protein